MYDRLVNNKRAILSLPLLLSASLFLALQAFPQGPTSGHNGTAQVIPESAYDGTGLVCITNSTTATNCPNSAPTIGPLAGRSTFSVGVFVNNSQALGGFDIFVASNPAFVTPTSAALGKLIVNPSLTSICINGVAQIGSCSVGTANGPGIVEVTTIENSGSNECAGISPCSGMAFTITYTVVGVPATGSTALSYPTAAGCSTSSVSAPANTCVLVDDAFGTTLPENIQGANVNINPSLVCITLPSTSTSCPVGTPTIGPIAVGQNLTVGVFVQNSPLLGGFDIYVSVNPNYLNPINATLGDLITNPAFPVICINGAAVNGGPCGTANGPGIVEASTIEGTGFNDPGTGLAFSITYRVVHATPGTPIYYPSGCPGSSNSSLCVLIVDSLGTVLPENAQGATVFTPIVIDPTITTPTCSPNPVVVGLPTFCTATATDTASFGATAPTGTVTWTTGLIGGTGFFSPSSCILQAINTFQSQCATFFTSQSAFSETGSTTIVATYSADVTHSGSMGECMLFVVEATPNLSTSIIVDQTGMPPPGGFVPLGDSVHDNVLLLGGFPLTGVTGIVTYTFFTNGGCSGTGTVISNVMVGPFNNVPPSLSVTPAAAGGYSFNATYSGDINDNAVTSACEPFTVSEAPAFTDGKLHWTHHLSLSKTGNAQSWTAIVENPLSTSVQMVVRIVGTSSTNPSLTFDVTCGVTCVNTASGGINFTPGLTPVTVAASTSSFSFAFNQPFTGNFVNQKITFTATVYWATGTLYIASTSKSGSFAVAP